MDNKLFTNQFIYVLIQITFYKNFYVLIIILLIIMYFSCFNEADHHLSRTYSCI